MCNMDEKRLNDACLFFYFAVDEVLCARDRDDTEYKDRQIYEAGTFNQIKENLSIHV